jgi:hypothetical protein
MLDAALKALPPASFQRQSVTFFVEGRLREAALNRGEYAQVVAGARDMLPRMAGVKLENENQQRLGNAGFAITHRQIGWGAYNLKDYATAESELRRSLDYLGKNPAHNTQEKVNLSEHRVQLAAAIARQGRPADAKVMIEPEVRYHRDLVAAGSEDANQHVLLAQALLVAAYASPKSEGRAYLDEATRIVEKLPAEMRKRRSVAQLRGWIEEAKRSQVSGSP